MFEDARRAYSSAEITTAAMLTTVCATNTYLADEHKRQEKERVINKEQAGEHKSSVDIIPLKFDSVRLGSILLDWNSPM